MTKAVHAELKARNIKLTEEDRATFKLKQKVRAIRSDEYKELRRQETTSGSQRTSQMLNQSDEMVAFLAEKQDKLLAAKET